MGVEIKRNKKGLYSMKSSISDESYHPKQKHITEDEAKKILIVKALYNFIEKAIEIDMEFPNRYYVNEKICRDEKPSFFDWIHKEINYDNDKLSDRFSELLKKYEIDLSFN